MDGFTRALRSAGSAVDALTAAYRFHLRWLRQHPALARLTLEVAASEAMGPPAARLARAFHHWLETHGLATDADPMIVGALVVGPVVELSRQRIVLGRSPAERDAVRLARSVHAGLGTLAMP